MNSGTTDVLPTASALIAHFLEAVAAVDLRVERETDLGAWARELGQAPGITAVSQAFDPDYCDLTDAFWLRLHDGRRLLGTIAAKKQVGDFLALQRSGELWFGRRAAEFGPIPLSFPADIPPLRGDLGYFGALWLHPDTRGIGMASVMARLVRAMAMRDWNLDWLCGGVLEGLALRDVPIRVYGYAHCVRISEEILFPVTGAPAVLYMPWESRREWLDTSTGFLARQQVAMPAAAAR